jgi:hypothetical protein
MGLLRPFRARNDEFHRIFYDSKSLAEWDHIEKIILLGILFQIGWILYLTLPTPVNSYDALGFYAFKAKIFYFADCIPEGFFKWNETTVSHPDYPLLVPFLMLWVYKFTGFNDVVIMRIMPIICIFFLALFYFQLKKFFDRKYALFSVFFLITAQQIAGYASIINADFVLLAFVTSGFLYLILYMHTLEKAYIVLSAIFFSFSLWVKNEAAVFIIAFFACFAVFLLKADRMVRRDIFKQLLTSIFIALVIAGPWFVYKFLNHVVNSDINSSNMTPERLLENIRSIPVLLNELQKQVFGPKKWNILWIVVMAVSALRYKKLCKNGFFYISLFILISVVGYFFAYMSTTSANLYYIANKTMSRFMIHFAGVAIFLAAFIFWDEPV